MFCGEVDGYPVRLSDIATIEKGVENDDLVVRANGQSAVGMQVLRQSQANTMDISNRVRAEIKLISETLPEGMEVIIDQTMRFSSPHRYVRF